MNIFIKQPFLIADIGMNFHDIALKRDISDLDAAKLMIRCAKSCGLDAVKFHSFKNENLFSDDLTANEFIKDSSFSIDSFKNFDGFGYLEFKQLADYCREIGIAFLSTPFDRVAVDYLYELVDVYPISSSDLTNLPFLKYVASKNKPIILSTGASTIKEIKEAINAIEETSMVNIALMHSVLSFPTSYEDANLFMIKDLVKNFKDYDIGYSDHTKSDENMFVLTTAYNYGAIILEKHFTLDKSLDGPDHIHSMDLDDVGILKEKLEFLSKINGYKNKQPLICESFMKKEYRRSIVARNDIKKGDLIKSSDLDFKRPGTGISPKDAENIIGKVASCNIYEDTLISWNMLEEN